MKPIKFRAWDVNKKVMLYQKDHDSRLKNMTWDGRVYENGLILPYVMMQYTGVKDKNGVEIFEGDIVKKDFGKGIETVGNVEWGGYGDGEYVDNVECWLLVNTNDKYFGEYSLSDLGGLYGCAKHTNEVIGNIYENPELLK